MDDQERLSTHAFMCQDKKHNPELVVVAFRGTEPFDSDSWQTDVDLFWYKLRGVGMIHGGFLKALGLQKGLGWPREIKRTELYAYYAIREKLREILGENENALAILFPLILSLHKEECLFKRFYTFGQPRVGCQNVGEEKNPIIVRVSRWSVKHLMASIIFLFYGCRVTYFEELPREQPSETRPFAAAATVISLLDSFRPQDL